MDEQSTTAAHHSTDSPRLISLLRGDLDWIVMKCLEKDRTRRYETANGLALDVVRHMSDEPVVARPPSTAYRFQKAWRRNKVVYASATAVVIALLLGTVISVWQKRIANDERHIAGEEKRKAEESEARKAEESEARARESEASARESEAKAKESEANALRRAYGSEMSLAYRDLEDNLFGSVQKIVSRLVPEPEAPDFRHWEWRYAWAQSQSDALRAWDISEEMDEVSAVQISPDQKYMVCSGSRYGPTKEHRIRILRDFQTREELKNVHLPGGSPRALAFSDSGKFLAVHRQTPDNVNEVHIYSTANWSWHAMIRLDKWISCLLFSPDEKTLVTIGTSKAVLWDWRQETPLFPDAIPSKGRGDSYCDLAFFPKGHRLAIGGAKELKIVDTQTGKIEYQQPARGRGITALAVSPDGDYVAIGFGFGISEIELLNTSAENPDRWEQEDPLVGHSRPVTSLAFADNGKQLISSSMDSTIRVWDMKRRVTTGVLRGHQGAVYDISLTSDESRAFSAGGGREILEWDPNVPLSQYRGRRLAESVREVVFSADSQSFYTIKGDGSVSIWDVETLNKKPWLSPKLGEQISIILSGDGKHLIAGTGSNKLWVLDAGNLQVVAERRVESRLILPVGFSADGKSLVALESGNKISLWNVENWQCISIRKGVPEAEYHTRNYSAIPPGSDMLFYVSKADLLLWDLKQSKKQAALPVNLAWHGGGGAAVSATEPLLAYFARGRGLILWNWQTRQEEDKLSRAAGSRVDFSPDGRRLLTGGGKGVALWDVSTRQEIASLDREVLTILRMLKFSPDGNTICAVDIEGTAYFWRAPSWDEINAIEAERNRKEVAR
jgi:WD40 repeat protein